MVQCRSLLASLALCSGVSATLVNVMLPLDTVTNQGELHDESGLGKQLDQLKGAAVDGFMVDVWWGATETTSKQYKFDAYQKLVSMAKARSMKVQFVASFHMCGGNVGDTCNIPLPAFVNDVADIWYTDKDKNQDKEYISLFADNVTIDGRTPLQMYSDWMAAMASTFSEDLGETITEIQVGMGPCGELRYPAYQLSHWQFCGVGAFQAFDKHAVASFQAAAKAAGHAEWNSPPTDAGDYNSRAEQTSFFQSGYTSEYGRFFLDWYFSSLKDHGAAVLERARAAFGNKVALAGKVAGIHWWYKAPHHAAELTAGYYNTDSHNGYDEIAKVFASQKAALDFTCLEMADSEQSASCDSGPEELVHQVMSAALNNNIGFNGENALPRYDTTAFNKIQSYRSGLNAFTYLRLSGDLLNGDNFNNFKNFVSAMHAGTAVVV
jgi:beta-amylase